MLRKLFPALVVAAAVVVSCLPLRFGFPYGHDWIFELVRIAEYKHALAAGQYPPFWADNLYGGYGSPIFLFYAPLFMLIASIFSAVFNSIAWGATAALILFTMCAAYFVMHMVCSALGNSDALAHTAARIAAYLYVLNPYLIGDKLLRNANAEFAALCVAPLAFWGLFAVRSTPRQGALLLAAGVALTTLAHNLTALAVATLLLLAALVLYPLRSQLSHFLYVCGGITLGLLMSAFFWLPALLMRSQVQLELMTSGRFDFHQNFTPIKTLFDGEFYSMGWWSLAILVVSILFAWYRPLVRHVQILNYAAVVAALILLALQLPLSTWIWERVPMLPLFQFPWRMMGLLALVIALLGALLFFRLGRGWVRTTVIAAELGVLALCIANAVPQLSQYQPLSAATSKNLPAALTAAAIRSTSPPATVLDEYLPNGASAATPFQFRAIQDPLLTSYPPVQARVASNISGRSTIEVIASEPATLYVARWTFPVWQATVNGATTQLRSGRLQNISIAVPAGRSEVILTRHPPTIRLSAMAVSLLAMLLWVALTLTSPRSPLWVGCNKVYRSMHRVAIRLIRGRYPE